MAEEPVRTSADLTGGDLQAKLAKTRNDAKKLTAKAATGVKLTKEEQERKDRLANIAVTAHKVTPQALEAQLEETYGNEGATQMISEGLTKSQIDKGHEKFGFNELTPPPQTPEWVKCLHTQKGFFNLLLWAGSILCFISYGLDQASPDNLYLGIVLAAVVIATGVFEYFQEKSSSDLMKKFASMQPPQVIVRRDGKETKVAARDLTHVSISLRLFRCPLSVSSSFAVCFVGASLLLF